MLSRDQFIDLRDVRLRLCVAGAGPALLLLHGWALDAAMWQPQFAGLAGCRLIAVDRRGFGLSSGEPDIAREVDDVLAILDTLAVQQAAILGMSQGARVALRFAQRLPDRVGCLILDGPPHLRATTIDELPMSHYRELVAAEGIEAFREQWLQHPLMRLHSGNPQAQFLLRDMVGRYPGRDLQRRGDRLAPQLDISAIASPALIINGEYDSAARRMAGDDLVRCLPNTRHAVVSGAGHLPNLDNPTAYNDLVASFVHLHMTKQAAGIT